MSRKIQLSPFLKIVFSTPDKKSIFFGYYNYSPISRDGMKVLAHRSRFEGRMPTANDQVEIGYYHLVENEWYPVAESKAFNWQQGTMLQWLGPDYNNKFIYNDAEDNRFVSHIIDIENKNIKTVPHPIYGVDPKGEFSISLKFERCYWTRAYNYFSVIDEKWKQNIPSGDGIFKVNLKTGKIQRIISIQDIVELSGGSDTFQHWFEHIMLNPTGNRFAFYHRYGSINEFHTIPYTADIYGKNIWQHPLKNGDRFSHLGWKDETSYVIFTIPENKRINAWKKYKYANDRKRSMIELYRRYVKPLIPRKITKSIINPKSHYALTEDQNGIIEVMDSPLLKRDGHPSFTKNGRFMLTDTYENEKGYRDLLLYDLYKKRVVILGTFYSTYNSCGWRADLHPRFSYDERFIIIDSSHNGHHQMIVLQLDWEKVKKK